jgi:hypothetical protein
LLAATVLSPFVPLPHLLVACKRAAISFNSQAQRLPFRQIVFQSADQQHGFKSNHSPGESSPVDGQHERSFADVNAQISNITISQTCMKSAEQQTRTGFASIQTMAAPLKKETRVSHTTSFTLLVVYDAQEPKKYTNTSGAKTKDIC